MKFQKLFLFFFCFIPMFAFASDILEKPEWNALWNNDEGFGVWIYENNGSCPEIRSRSNGFIVLGANKPLSESELKSVPTNKINLCSLWTAAGPKAICVDGALRIEFDEKLNEYHGEYDLKFNDGSNKKGEFRAQYCKPGF